jgi:hypothetical protein
MGMDFVDPTPALIPVATPSKANKAQGTDRRIVIEIGLESAGATRSTEQRPRMTRLLSPSDRSSSHLSLVNLVFVGRPYRLYVVDSLGGYNVGQLRRIRR